MHYHIHQKITMTNNNQVKYDKSRGSKYVVATLVTVRKKKKDHQEDPSGHIKCLNDGTLNLDLLGIVKRIRSQLVVMPLRV